ncbi:hypothetical protein CJ030_MR1G001454 [Morella rubra]|uniref:Uncharacterized protein n=1 Tax=Morella rubra TaxID=262757 RepID=A0A6A1WS04_9ROSI|nr:hypothetical protein CJ030_MR1G001454 [Morella rubra]
MSSGRRKRVISEGEPFRPRKRVRINGEPLEVHGVKCFRTRIHQQRFNRDFRNQKPIEILRVILDYPTLDEIVNPKANDLDIHRHLLHPMAPNESWSSAPKSYEGHASTSHSVPSGSHETRHAVMEASIKDLKDQMTTMHEDMKTCFEELKSILTSHNTDFDILQHKVRSTHHNYNNNMTICRETMWKRKDDLHREDE